MAVTRWLQLRPMMGCGSLIGSWFLIEGETKILNKVEDGKTRTLTDALCKEIGPNEVNLHVKGELYANISNNLNFQERKREAAPRGFWSSCSRQRAEKCLRTLGTLFSSMMFPDRTSEDVYLYTTFVGGSRNKELAKASRIQLQRLLETRKAMLRKEQEMAYHRALVAGFETENMNDLIFFADHYGASHLREACIEFRDLCKKKHNDGLWMDELAAITAYPPSELAYTGTSGILIATESNASTLNNELNFEHEGDKSTDQVPSTPSNVPMQMPWPNQMPYMYNYPGPQGPRYPYPCPGMPPYYPAHIN
ncbi:putative protoporphyrinogen oxidase [Helianthus annuus]|nr:putative protoporphyrinogen oxidase [Helianthus annuus]